MASNTRSDTQPGSPESISSPLTSSPNGLTRQNRIHFPAETGVDSGKDYATGGAVEEQHGPALHEEKDGVPSTSHRRVFSVDAAGGSNQLAQAALPIPSSLSRRSFKEAASHITDSDHNLRRQEQSSAPSGSLRSQGLSLHSDVDAQDDPNILADLQKALRYKTRVEEHFRASLSNSRTSSPLLGSSSPSRVSPVPFQVKTSNVSPPQNFRSVRDKELVDFSPSVGRVPKHPVPTSADDGVTLDWSGTILEDDKRERKWSMPLRRGSREKYPQISNKVLVQKQEALYFEKLAGIKSKASPQSLRKAEMVKDQLDRRYTLLNASLTSYSAPIYLNRAARWYTTQDDIFKKLVIESEPLFWLRHLLHGKTPVSPWHLSALIVEEYVRSNLEPDFAHNVAQNNSAPDVTSNAGSSLQAAVSRPTSSKSTDLISMRKKSDDLISFEPITNHSRRDSLGGESKISNDGHFRRWRHSLTALGKDDSQNLSPLSIKQRHGSEPPPAPGQSSPLSTRSPLQSLGIRKRARGPSQNSEDGQSSALDSSDGGRHTHDDQSRNHKRSRFHLSLDLKAAEDAKSHNDPGPLSIAELKTDALPSKKTPAKSRSLPTEEESGTNANKESLDAPRAPYLDMKATQHERRQSELQRHADALKRHLRVSLPTSLRPSISKATAQNARNDHREQNLEAAYIRKREALETLKQLNSRMKYTLQAGTKAFLDFDDAHHLMADKLGLPYTRIPPEVMEAFTHDPATRPNRRLNGWRLVEDINLRLERQRDTLAMFTSSITETIKPFSPSIQVYDEAVKTLSERLEQLHAERSEVLHEVRRTNEAVARVKDLRDKLKPAYDEIGRYTSANYPELVQLESLLDEFTNQKNHLWRISETAISFVLTSVAPIMKTFGRPIWDELHDFLVIPIYRNDFSGEDHWYPVTFPRRSFLHWTRLITFSVISPYVLMHGIRLFINLLTEGYLLRIPDFIPWFLIYSGFSTIMFAYAVALFILLVTVLCEFAIILWWSAWILCIVK